MRILLVNKYHYLRSGTERYLFNLRDLLESRGHTVEVFATGHPENQPSTWEECFAPHVDYRRTGALGSLRAAAGVVWSRRAARAIASVLDGFRPDRVHLLNVYHQLSPSILPPIARRRIPIVQTLNDYKLICPNYLLYTEGRPCQRCRDRRYLHAVRHRCLHGSLAWSAVAALEMTVHKRLRLYERHVSRFLAPSRFLADRLLDFGIAEKQVRLLPYFLADEAFADEAVPEDGDYLLFVGRLSPEKGLATLLEAASRAQVPLRIAGDGPLRSFVEERLAREGRHSRLLGFLEGTALRRAVDGARAVVVPSTWYEVFGQVIVEAFARGRPVIASAIGGMPELVDDGADGLLVPPGDADALAAALERLRSRPEQARAMGAAGRRKARARFGAAQHYHELMEIYGEVGD